MNNERQAILAMAAIVLVIALLPAGATEWEVNRSGDSHGAHPPQAITRNGNSPSQEARTDTILSKPLPDLPGKEVVMMTVTYPPGHSGAVHRHNAHGFIYLLEGSVVMAINGRAPVTLGTGQTFYEGPNDIHTISRNASNTRPAKFLVFLIKDKGAPISVVVPQVDHRK